MHFSCGSGVVILTETRIRKEFDSEKGTNPNALTGRLYGLKQYKHLFRSPEKRFKLKNIKNFMICKFLKLILFFQSWWQIIRLLLLLSLDLISSANNLSSKKIIG